MKIKQACEITGLTDKTIRFYIDNELITPDCTENYLGRRSFTFSEENLRELDDIAILRKAGFSVAQIKEIQSEKEKSREIIAQLIELKEKQIEENKLINAALSQLEGDKAYSVREIAEVLREPASEVKVLNDEGDIWYILYKWGKWVMIALWLLCSLCAAVTTVEYAFKAIIAYAPLSVNLNIGRAVLTWCVILVPVIVFLISLLVKKRRKIKSFSLKHNMIVFLILLIFFFITPPYLLVFLGVFHDMDYGARTSSPEDYLIVTHEVEQSDDFYRIFPEQIPAYVMQMYYSCNHKGECNCKKPVYYYTNYLDWDVDLYEMYAEWILDEDDFAAEVDRIYSVGGTECNYGDYTVKYFEYEEDWQGRSCLAFAYNRETRCVRYIYYYGYRPEGEKPYCERVEWADYGRSM
ncbi:MAG: MerR family transcriptional regulator [Clostridia bacterium]|nr:MerR family transcriptional regulator [Clostridia bacterium]